MAIMCRLELNPLIRTIFIENGCIHNNEIGVHQGFYARASNAALIYPDALCYSQTYNKIRNRDQQCLYLKLCI